MASLDLVSSGMNSIRQGQYRANTAAAEIARRSRGTPRIANRLLRRVRDYAERVLRH